MSDKPLSIGEQIKHWLLWQLATLANRYCGQALLSWNSPQEWEEYFSIGQPYKPEAPHE